MSGSETDEIVEAIEGRLEQLLELASPRDKKTFYFPAFGFAYSVELDRNPAWLRDEIRFTEKELEFWRGVRDAAIREEKTQDSV